MLILAGALACVFASLQALPSSDAAQDLLAQYMSLKLDVAAKVCDGIPIHSVPAKF